MLIRRQGICTSEQMERHKRLKVHPEILKFLPIAMNQIAKPLQSWASIASSLEKSNASLQLATSSQVKFLPTLEEKNSKAR